MRGDWTLSTLFYMSECRISIREQDKRVEATPMKQRRWYYYRGQTNGIHVKKDYIIHMRDFEAEIRVW